MAYHGIFDERVCDATAAVFAICGAISLLMGLLLFFLRHNAGIASRHPLFSICHCVVSLLFCILVIPLSCLLETRYILFFLVRAMVIFAWFWASLCRYRMLQFDNDFLAAMKMAAASRKGGTKWALNKKDFGNATLSASIIASYFVICLIILIAFCYISNVHKIDSLRRPGSNGKSDAIFAELIFTVMCIIPFAVIMFWVPHSIWDIQESWRIRDELVFIFIATSILFFWDTAATAFRLFLEFEQVMAIKMYIEAVMLIVTMLMCSVWVVFKVPRDKVNKAPEPEKMLEKIDTEVKIQDSGGRDATPLGYVLSTEYGYKAFLQHCVDEINVENLQFLSEICFFKKQFLERIEKLYFQSKQKKKFRQSAKYEDDALLPADNIDFEPWKAEPNFANRFSVGGALSRRMGNQNKRDNIPSDRLRWSPSNSLAILTLKMKHGLEMLPELKEDFDNNNGNMKNNSKRNKKKQNIIAEWHKKYKNHRRNRSTPGGNDKSNALKQLNSTSNIEETLFKRNNATVNAQYSQLNQQNSNEPDVGMHNHNSDDFESKDDRNSNFVDDSDDIPLYVMGYGLYLKFIKEGGDAEINISSKTRTQLHYFFHPRNLTKLDHAAPNAANNGGGGGNVGLTVGGPTAGGPNHRTPNGQTPGLNSNSITPRGPNVTKGGFGDVGGGGGGGGGRNGRHGTAGGPNDVDNEELYLYELLKERENPNSRYSYQHLYKLYHTFDGAWAEIFHLIVSNVYPRFTSAGHYTDIQDRLAADLIDEKSYLLTLLNGECNDWFERVRPRSLVIIGVDPVPIDEQISYWGKPLERGHYKIGRV